MDALFNISYGLYVITVKGEKQNGCIANTVLQVTSSPKRISVTLNKSEELAKELGERVRRGIMSAKEAKARLSRVRSASNNRVDLLRDAVNKSRDARNENYVKPAGPILSRLENFARTGAAFYGHE